MNNNPENSSYRKDNLADVLAQLNGGSTDIRDKRPLPGVILKRENSTNESTAVGFTKNPKNSSGREPAASTMTREMLEFGQSNQPKKSADSNLPGMISKIGGPSAIDEINTAIATALETVQPIPETTPTPVSAKIPPRTPRASADVFKKPLPTVPNNPTKERPALVADRANFEAIEKELRRNALINEIRGLTPPPLTSSSNESALRTGEIVAKKVYNNEPQPLPSILVDDPEMPKIPRDMQLNSNKVVKGEVIVKPIQKNAADQRVRAGEVVIEASNETAPLSSKPKNIDPRSISTDKKMQAIPALMETKPSPAPVEKTVQTTTAPQPEIKRKGIFNFLKENRVARTIAAFAVTLAVASGVDRWFGDDDSGQVKIESKANNRTTDSEISVKKDTVAGPAEKKLYTRSQPKSPEQPTPPMEKRVASSEAAPTADNFLNSHELLKKWHAEVKVENGKTVVTVDATKANASYLKYNEHTLRGLIANMAGFDQKKVGSLSGRAELLYIQDQLQTRHSDLLQINSSSSFTVADYTQLEATIRDLALKAKSAPLDQVRSTWAPKVSSANLKKSLDSKK